MADARKLFSALKCSPVDFKVERKKQPTNAFLQTVAKALHENIIDKYLHLSTRANLSQSCIRLYSIYQPNLYRQRLQQLLQAVVDDQFEQAKYILDSNPNLLLAEPDEKQIIQSQYTWQKFYAENALIIAAKRGQLEMIELMLAYLDKRPYKKSALKIKNHALTKLAFIYEYKEEEQGNIHIPRKYIALFESIINTITKKTFSHGDAISDRFSDATEEALSQFRNQVLSKEPIKLDDSFNPDLLICAAFKTFRDNIKKFEIPHKVSCFNGAQMDLFSLKVFGFIQSLVTPRTAENFHTELIKIIEADCTISPERRAYRISRNSVNRLLYRSSPDSLQGLGFEYLYPAENLYDPFGLQTPYEDFSEFEDFWKEHIKIKQRDCKNLCNVQAVHIRALKISS